MIAPAMEDLHDNAHEFDSHYFTKQLSDTTEQWHQLIQDEHEIILKRMPPRARDRILDVGCGKGRIEHFLLNQEPKIEMVSCDVTQEAKKYIKSTFVLCSMSAMPFPDASFDKVFCQQVLSHFRDGQQGIEEAFRVLKKGGKLMVLTPNKYYVYAIRVASILRLIPNLKYDATARWLYSKRSLNTLFSTRPWSSVEFLYFQSAPKNLPFEWMRAKIIAVATK